MTTEERLDRLERAMRVLVGQVDRTREDDRRLHMIAQSDAAKLADEVRVREENARRESGRP